MGETFVNHALNTMWTFASKTVRTIPTSWLLELKNAPVTGHGTVEIADARTGTATADVWITDPPYADAVSYHELSEYPLAWTATGIAAAFPSWPTDSRRALAIRGSGDDFRANMVDAYRSLARRTPADGVHCVMFTHQDVAVWADLTLILWAAGLTVTAAWCIRTETDTAQKAGYYVQGTVLLVLRKQLATSRAFLSDLTPRIEDEVVSQLDQMVRLDEGEGLPSFGDADYQLAAYAAALRVLTSYRGVEEIDVEREFRRPRARGGRGRREPSPIERVIRDAVSLATNHLVPRGIQRRHWLRLSADERFYLKALDVESRGERRVGAFMELGLGFGVADFGDLLFSRSANDARFCSATELGARKLEGPGFARSTLRLVLFAVSMADAAQGRQFLKDELGPMEYWERRELVIALLTMLERLGSLAHWARDADAAHLLSGSVQADSL